MRITKLLILTMTLVTSTAISAQTSLRPTPLDGLNYAQPLLSGSYNPEITAPSSILGFPLGSKTASPAQIVDIVTKLSQQSDRAVLVEYARSHENRPLYYVVISSPENLTRIDAVKAGLARLSDPRGLSASEATALINDLPAVAWMAYSIHGDETSGGDSALAAIYHLVASSAEDVTSLLDRAIIIIDPSMNPDGRARFIKAIEEARGLAPNIDDQSMPHTQSWPGGRYNHYLFDLNRDFIHGIHPETRGRIRAINEWRPQLVIDAHEMGSQSTYHFTPSRQPINLHFPPALHKWNLAFAKDQAQEFDRRAWPYFNGELFDDLYPGYTAYSQYRGALNILYEQAHIAKDGVRGKQGQITTYQEAVHHHLVSTLTNLNTLANQSKHLYRDYLADRRYVLSSGSPYANRNFVILPTDNQSRMRSFIDTMKLQGFEIFSANRDISVRNVLTQMGNTIDRATIPKGSIVLPNRQPEARLLGTMLEFETSITDATLLKERQSILRGDGSTMYDVTAWNTTMLHALEAWTVAGDLAADLEPYEPASLLAGLSDVPHAIGWVVNGSDDHSVSFAARAMELGLELRVINKAAELDNIAYPRGSVVVTRNDNRNYTGDLAGAVAALASELGLSAQGFASGTGAGDLPDIGGQYFVLLEQPRIAIVTQGTMNPLDVGATWHTVDKFLGIRHSMLHQNRLESFDLRRYNVLVLPDSRSAEIPDKAIEHLAAWVENGGTLIAVKGSAAALSAADREFTSVRQIADTFEEQDKYDLALQREWLESREALNNLQQVWANVVPEEVHYPWPADAKKASNGELQKQDDWQKLFMPTGAVLSGRSNHNQWLTYGTDKVLPVLFGNGPVLMTDSKSEAAVRLGVLTQIDQARWKNIKAESERKKTVRKIGWSSLPDKYELNLRMSGLLWPEAAQRLANAVYLTREAKGNGQVILFADSPAFRGSTLGTNRLLLNALVYGPALGAKQPIIP